MRGGFEKFHDTCKTLCGIRGRPLGRVEGEWAGL